MKKQQFREHELKFSFYFNGKRIKINLKNYHSKYFKKYQKDEEGYSTECFALRRENQNVFLYITFIGKDCDGKLTQHFNYLCNQEELKKGLKGTPKWKLIANYQEDQFAELMNY